MRAVSSPISRMSCGSCCKGGACAVCKIVAGLIALVFTLTTVAAAVGVWNTHMTLDGWTFGTTPGSAALFVFVVSLMVWFKTVKKMCPCRSAGCGSGCGSSCGGCPCGKENCNCPKSGCGKENCGC